MDKAIRLIETIFENSDRNDLDELANELLSEYYRGGDVSSLTKLLHSENDRIVASGTWIAAELAEAGNPLLPEIKRLLGHRSRRVRFFAIECVQEWAGPLNSEELAIAISLLDDQDEAVRWRALGFLALAPRSQLECAMAGFAVASPDSPYLSELRWILGSEATDPAMLSVALQDANPRHRKFATAAAVRVAKLNVEPLRFAATSDESEIAQFARDMLERISLA